MTVPQVVLDTNFIVAGVRFKLGSAFRLRSFCNLLEHCHEQPQRPAS